MAKGGGGNASQHAARQAGATTLTQNSENFGYSRMRLRRIAKLQFGIVNPVELVSTQLHVSTTTLVGVWRAGEMRNDE
jgi:hypothetical protein